MSEKEIAKIIDVYALNHEGRLIESYISQGPKALQSELGLDESQWLVIFDYLAFEHNLLYKCVLNSIDFFTKSYIEHGSTHVRSILNILDAKYDLLWAHIFDFIAISHGAVQYHFLHFRAEYVKAFRQHGGDFVRKVLGLWEDKYEESWLEILNAILHGYCEDVFSEQTFDHGLRSFSLLMNQMREHRIIK